MYDTEPRISIVSDRPTRTGTRTVVRVRGELDLLGAQALRFWLRPLESRRDPVVLDLSATSFIDAAGVRLLVGLSEDAAATGWQFGVRATVGSRVERVLELTGAEPWITFEPVARPLPRAV